MSNMVRIFTGTVEQVLAPNSENNPFSIFRPYYHGNQPYQLIRVNLSSPSGEAPQLLCFADFPVKPGDSVKGLSCRIVKGIPAGVLLEKDFEPLLTLGAKLEWLAEYTAFRHNHDSSLNRTRHDWYMKYPQNDEARAEALVRSVMDDHGIGSTKAILTTALVDSCTPKNRRMFCTGTLTVQLTDNNGNPFSFQISRHIDYEIEKGTSLPVLIYLGQEHDPAIHILPLAPTFAYFIRKMDEATHLLLARFLAGNAFRMLGRALFVSDYAPDGEDRCYRIMVTGQVSGPHYSARALSLYNAAENNWDTTYVSKKWVFPGTILDAEVTTDPEGKFRFSRPVSTNAPAEPEKEPVPAESDQSDAPSENTHETNEPGDLLSVREHEISLWREEPEHDRSKPGKLKKDYSFKSSRFQWALLNREIDTLHYDVLHWIGMLNYTTGNHIFRLFLSGILPQDPEALSEIQKQDAASIVEKHMTKQLLLPEGDSTYPMEFTARRSGSDKLNKIINKLRDLGLIEFASFRTQQNVLTPAKVLILTEHGKNLLKVLQRRNGKHDTFAYLRSIRHVKTILSANQLCITYIQGLHKRHPFQPEELRIGPTIVVRYEQAAEDSMVRVGFTLPLNNPDGSKTVMLMGESIRNTVGLSKPLDDQSIREKIPRMLSIVRRSAETQQQHRVLTIVFTSYDEMMSYADFIRDELSKLEVSEYFHVYMTYDLLLMGPLDGSHFRFHPQTGNLERVQGVTAQIEGYLQ